VNTESFFNKFISARSQESNHYHTSPNLWATHTRSTLGKYITAQCLSQEILPHSSQKTTVGNPRPSTDLSKEPYSGCHGKWRRMTKASRVDGIPTKASCHPLTSLPMLTMHAWMQINKTNSGEGYIILDDKNSSWSRTATCKGVHSRLLKDFWQLKSSTSCNNVILEESSTHTMYFLIVHLQGSPRGH
jgi:hypothetical protein